MKIIEAGHVYQLRILDHEARFPSAEYDPPSDLLQFGQDLLVFVNREEGSEHAGYQTQDVIAALIDRTQHCDACIRWEGNDKIIYHLRMALALHEARAIERKVEKGELAPELVSVDNDGHFPIRSGQSREKQRNVARAVQDGRLNAMPPERMIDEVHRALKDECEVRVIDVAGRRQAVIGDKSGEADTGGGIELVSAPRPDDT